MRRCPSFSARPGFPAGLRVLVLDPDPAAAAHTCSALAACTYKPISCSSTAEALKQLDNIQTQDSIDLILAEEHCFKDSTALQTAAKSVSLLLISNSNTPADIISGIRRGAVDFLQKPLQPTRLRNIWQHVVRRMMQAGTASAGSLMQQPARRTQRSQLRPRLPPTWPGRQAVVAISSPQQQPAAGASIEEGESHSNVSSSEPAANPAGDQTRQAAMELDPVTSSLLDAADAALGNPLASLSGAFPEVLRGPNAADRVNAAGGAALAHVGHNSKIRGADLDMPMPVTCPPQLVQDSFSQPQQRSQVSASQQQPHAGCLSTRQPADGQHAKSRCVQGHAAGGCLPVLDSQEMVWGLPVRPLQIVPRPAAGMRVPGLLAGCGMVPALMAQAVMPWLIPGMVPGVPSGIMAPATAAALASAGTAAAARAGTASTTVTAATAATHTSICNTFPLSIVPGGDATATVPAELLKCLSSRKVHAAPIGLQLKKSASLMELINGGLHPLPQ